LSLLENLAFPNFWWPVVIIYAYGLELETNLSADPVTGRHKKKEKKEEKSFYEKIQILNLMALYKPAHFPYLSTKLVGQILENT